MATGHRHGRRVRTAGVGGSIDTTVIACIGAGVVGRSWAVVFARAGHHVRMCDRDASALERAERFLNEVAGVAAASGAPSDAESFRARITLTTDVVAALAGCAFAQESVAENVALKRATFALLGRHAPADAVLASSTSSISGAQFMGEVLRPERCLVAHPLNPPHVIPLVELCPSPWTSADTMERARRLFSAAGQRPIVLQREVDGFVANRLQIALLREALHLIGEGVCEADDIDGAMLEGLGLRWAVCGPLQAGALNDDAGYGAYMRKYRAAFDRIAAGIDVRYPISDALIDRVEARLRERPPRLDLAGSAADRDAAVLALRRHLGR
jgi:L-gulonate 3-dehydrogenase